MTGAPLPAFTTTDARPGPGPCAPVGVALASRPVMGGQAAGVEIGGAGWPGRSSE